MDVRDTQKSLANYVMPAGRHALSFPLYFILCGMDDTNFYVAHPQELFVKVALFLEHEGWYISFAEYSLQNFAVYFVLISLFYVKTKQKIYEHFQ